MRQFFLKIKQYNGFSKRFLVLMAIFCFVNWATILTIEIAVIRQRNINICAILLVLTVPTVSMFLLLKKYIYAPIQKLEKAIEILETADTDLKAEMFEPSDYYVSDKLNRMLMNLKNAMNREYSERILKKQAELNALQSQINPHFLYNTLESIRGQALMEGVDEIADMTEALATFFRYSISQKGNFVTLRDELKNVENYFKIQRYRFEEHFDLSIFYEMDEEAILDYKMPKLTLQPIVENCIYHGLEPKMSKGQIEIRILTTEKRLLIDIGDNGVGMPKERLYELNEKLENCMSNTGETQQQSKGGIALMNVNQRIKLLYGDDFGLHVSSSVMNGTDIQITLPLIVDETSLSLEFEVAYEKRNT